MANFITKGPKYSTVELTKVASRKTGEIETQCALSNDFLDAELNLRVLENGAVVYIDAEKDEVVKTKGSNCVNAMYLHFSNPRRYEDGRSGMENFRFEENEDYETMGVKMCPRLYKLTSGDMFMTDYFTKSGASLPTGIKEVKGGFFKDMATMPNDREGKLYRVI